MSTIATREREARIIRIAADAFRNDPATVFQRKKKIGRALAWIAPTVLLILWQISSDQGWIDKRTFASPVEVALAAWDMTASGMLWDNLKVTIQRIGVGYVSGSLVGIVLGTALGWSVLARSAFRPMIRAAQTAPLLGIFPLLLMIFGLGELPKYLMVAFGMSVLVSLGTIDAVAGVPTSYIEAARSLGTPRRQMFLEVVMPAALERIITSLRIGVGLGVLSTIGVEFVAANEGVGRIIWTSWNLFLPADMFVGIIIACLLGVVCNALIDLLQRIVMPWRREGDRVVN